MGIFELIIIILLLIIFYFTGQKFSNLLTQQIQKKPKSQQLQGYGKDSQPLVKPQQEELVRQDDLQLKLYQKEIDQLQQQLSEIEKFNFKKQGQIEMLESKIKHEMANASNTQQEENMV